MFVLYDKCVLFIVIVYNCINTNSDNNHLYSLHKNTWRISLALSH